MIVGVIRNPVSGGGRMRARWGEFEDELRSRFSNVVFQETTQAGDASRMAHEMAIAGFDLVIAVGGDGTIGDVADGLLRVSGKRPDMAFIPSGTGSDFARNFKIAKSAPEIIEAIEHGPLQVVDAGKVTYTNDRGGIEVRHFINIASLGISGEIDRVVNAIRTFGKSSGKLVFKFHTIRELLRFRFRDVWIKLDEQPAFEARVAVIVVANAPWFGGGMKIAPHALYTDGLFDVVVFRAASRLRLIWDLNSVYSGAHLTNPLVSVHRAKTVEVTPKTGQELRPAVLDIDGESPGTIPVRYEIVPQALVLRAVPI